jgi:lysozyme
MVRDLVERLRDELAADEGVVYEVYLDHLSLPTFGIGHLVRPTDPEYGQPVGTPVSEERVNACFFDDIETTLSDCEILYSNFNDIPDDAQLVLANMMFNLGRPRLSKFKALRAAVEAEDWACAADEMVDSRWYRQVPNRAQRLVNRMRLIA